MGQKKRLPIILHSENPTKSSRKKRKTKPFLVINPENVKHILASMRR